MYRWTTKRSGERLLVWHCWLWQYININILLRDLLKDLYTYPTASPHVTTCVHSSGLDKPAILRFTIQGVQGVERDITWGYRICRKKKPKTSKTGPATNHKTEGFWNAKMNIQLIYPDSPSSHGSVKNYYYRHERSLISHRIHVWYIYLHLP